MSLKPWKLLRSEVALAEKHFPVEKRTYQLPNGCVISDFYVTTIGDVSMIVPITKNNTIVLVRQYKPGANAILIEFPAGRIESHENFLELAQEELEEETGIRVSPDTLKEIGVLTGFSTKGTERVHVFVAEDCEFNSVQKFDANEEIEVLELSFKEMDQLIVNGEIWAGQTIAAWTLFRLKQIKHL